MELRLIFFDTNRSQPLTVSINFFLDQADVLDADVLCQD